MNLPYAPLTQRELNRRAMEARQDVGYAAVSMLEVNGRIACDDRERLTALACLASTWGHAAWSRIEADVAVIDPEDREQVAKLALSIGLYRAQDNMFGALRSALRSLVTDPKPEEPKGLGAVVRDGDGEPWVRFPTQNAAGHDWSCAHSTGRWEHIDAVEVLSEGVTQ